MNLKNRLQAVKTRNKTDKQTIEDAITFINKVLAYSAKQEAAFGSLGYVPVGRVQSNDR